MHKKIRVWTGSVLLLALTTVTAISCGAQTNTNMITTNTVPDLPPETPHPNDEQTPNNGSPTPNPDQNNNGQTNQNNNPSQPPNTPPNFPPNFFPNFNSSQSNAYPDYAANFTKLDPKAIYQEIYDRTFSLRYGFEDQTNSTDDKYTESSVGTTWLIDYHKYANQKEQYKLFFATNLHVLANFSNTLTDEQNKHLNYYDPTNSKAKGIALGKSVNVPNFAPQPNNKVDATAGQVHFFTNNAMLADQSFSKTYGKVTTKSDVFTSEPKLVFAAVDYLSEPALNQFQTELQSKYNSYLENQKKPDGVQIDADTLKRQEIRTQYQAEIKKIPLYSDFAIFEIDVDLNESQTSRNESSQPSLQKWLTAAIKAVDAQLMRNQTSTLPNYDGNGPIMNTDYFSVANNELTHNKLNNAKDLFIAGYPSNPNSNNTVVWMQNNPIERNDPQLQSYSSFRYPVNQQAFAYSTNDFESKAIDSKNLQIYDVVWNRIFGDSYGVNYNVKFSSLFFGASGSIVVNEFGQTVGIYSAVRSNVAFGNLLDTAFFTPLLLTKDRKTIDQTATVYGYNLIDGTNFANQTRSYKQNLQYLYPNGFSKNEQTTGFQTALFPNGFNSNQPK